MADEETKTKKKVISVVCDTHLTNEEIETAGSVVLKIKDDTETWHNHGCRSVRVLDAD